jgi:chromosome partitioning protein
MLITIAAYKGGVGKTTLAYEVAAALEGVLVDLDWDGGGATRMWGDDPRRRHGSPLLDAFERGRGVPRTRSRLGQPTLVPSSPDLASSRINSDLVADCLIEWARTWAPRPLVVDTHPGANPLTEGALLAADVVAVPVVLAERELDALEQMLDELSAYRVVLVPNMVPPVPPARLVTRLSELAHGAQVPVLGMVSEHRWIRRRLRRRAVVAEPSPGRAVAKAAGEYRSVADQLRTTAARYAKEAV